jgi:ribose transport system permease protein
MVIARGLCLLGTGGRPLGLFDPAARASSGSASGRSDPIPVVIMIFVVVVVVFDFLLRRTTAFRKVSLHRQQREGRGLFRHPDQAGDLPDDDALLDALRRRRHHLHGPLRLGAADLRGRHGAQRDRRGGDRRARACRAGKGTILGAILGAILLSVVSSSLALLDVSVYWQDIIRGSILLAAVTFDHYLVKRQAQEAGHERVCGRLHVDAADACRAGAAFHRRPQAGRDRRGDEPVHLEGEPDHRQARRSGMVKISIETPFQR